MSLSAYDGPFAYPALDVGLYSARPAAGHKGARYVTTDAGVEWVDDGAVWRPLLDGRIGTQVPLVASFSAFGSGGTYADASGVLTAVAAGGGSNQLAGLLENTPGAAFTLTTHQRGQANSVLNVTGGLGIVASDGTKYTSLWVYNTQATVGVAGAACRIAVVDWNDAVTFSAEPEVAIAWPLAGSWLRIKDDGTTTTLYQISADGVQWFTLLSRSRTAFLTPTKCGLVMNTGNALAGSFDSFTLTTP